MKTGNILIFRSNIKTNYDRISVERMLDMHPHIDEWTLDQQDEDCVLRVVTGRLSSTQVVDIVKGCGYICEEMPD
jgi:cell fate (sporulation/competence/biofilm development) regulator YmcA (YheA/YmcA/DUF963 family)